MNIATTAPFLGFQSFGESNSQSSISAMAANAIARVIPGYDGTAPNSFARSLATQFKFQERDGLSVPIFAPSGIAGSVNSANLPEALAEFFNLASARIAEARASLSGLEPLCEAEHKDCCNDLRDVIGAKFDELESAIGAEFGPCTNWVNEVFVQLLGDRAKPAGLADDLVKEYTNGKKASCPDEERKLAKLRIFVGSLEALRDEWKKFSDFFITKPGSVSLVAAKCLQRVKVMAFAVQNIERGLASVGIGEAFISVENLDPDVPNEGTVLYALRRLSRFATQQAPSLLSTLGEGSLQSLDAESKQLIELAEALEDWLSEMLPSASSLKDLIANMKDEPDQITGVTLAVKGVISSASTLVAQMTQFQKEIAAV